MARIDRNPTRLYSHADAVAILRIDPDRLRNFVRVPVYAAVLSSAQRIGGRGKGTRMLYGWFELAKLAVADSLLTIGWTPMEIARACGALARHDFTLPRDYERAGAESALAPVLVRWRDRWHVWQTAKLRDPKSDWPAEVLFQFPLLPVTLELVAQIEQLEANALPKRKRNSTRKDNSQ